jgi:multiple sugar transport system permease protein
MKPETFYLLLILPSLFFILGVKLFPIGIVVLLSFYETTAKINFDKPVAFENYIGLLAEERFINNIKVTFIFVTETIIITLVLSLALALALQRSGKLYAGLRTLILTAWVIMGIAAATMWRLAFNYSAGAINGILYYMGFPRVDFMLSPVLALQAMIMTSVWRYTPFATILLWAGLKSIEKEYYESAKVDGANRFQQFRHITLPLLKPTLIVLLLLLTIYSFYATEIPLALTEGGPFLSTETLSLRLYREAFEYFAWGRASALSMFLFMFNLIAGLSYLKILMRRR